MAAYDRIEDVAENHAVPGEFGTADAPASYGRGAAIFSEQIGAYCLAFIAAMGFVSVVARYLFSAPIPDAFDFSELLLGILVFWGVASATFHGEHIKMDAVWTLCGPGGRRVLDVIAALIVFGFLAVLAVMLEEKVWESYMGGETTFGLGIVVWPFHLAAALGILAAAILAFCRVVSILRPLNA